MLKNIGALFERRKKIFNRSQDTNSQINNSIKAFLKEKFGEDLKGCSLVVSYNSKDNSLTMTADSKIIANELALQLDDLSRVLKKDGIKLDRILVR